MSAMNFLQIFCCLTTLVCCCYGGCFKMPSPSGMSGFNSIYGPCYYRGEVIPRGHSVTRNCFSCYCGEFGVLSCCSVGTKLKRHPHDCKKIVSEDGCYEHAVKMSDERSPCTYGVGMVGR